MQLPNHATDDYVSAFGKMFADLRAKNGAALRTVSPAERGRRSITELSMNHPTQLAREFLRKRLARARTVARDVASPPTLGRAVTPASAGC